MIIRTYNLIIFLIYCLPFAQTFSGAGGEIPKNDYQIYDMGVTGVGELNTTYGLEKVCINILFPTDENIKVALRSPFGSITYLTQNNGGQGSDYANTCFDDKADEYIFQGSPPYNGTYIPESSLGILNNNRSGNGTWSLLIFNDSNKVGQLISWSLTFGNNPALPPVVPGVPSCYSALSTECNNATDLCDFKNAYCGTYDTSSGPPYTKPRNTYFRFKAGELSARFMVWLKNGQPDRTPNGPIPMYFKLNIYKGDCNTLTSNNLITSFNIPYNLDKDYTYYMLSLITERCETYTAVVTGTGGDCTFDYVIQPASGLDTKEIIIAPDAPTICSGDSVDLKITQGCGPFIWSPALGLNTTTGDIVTASPTQTTTYTVTSIGPCPKTKSVIVNVVPRPIANAGNDQQKCSNIFEMNANSPDTGEDGHWEVISGTVSPSNSVNPKQIFILLSNKAILRWIVKNNYCSSSDDVMIENTLPPNVNLNFNYITPVCIIKYNELNPNLNPQFLHGGIFSSSSGLSIHPSTGVIDLTKSLPGSYIINYTIYINSICGNAIFATTLEIKPYLDPVVDFIYPFAICKDAGIVSPTLPSNFKIGGIFSSSAGLDINASSGLINVNNSQVGIYTINYKYLGSLDDCFSPKSYSQTISISYKPDYKPNYEDTSCDANGKGIGSFNLNSLKSKLTSEANPNIKFYISLQDAQNEEHEIIANLNNYNNTIAYSDKIFASIKVSGKCTVYSEITLTVYKNPYSDILGEGPYYLCKGESVSLNAGAGFKFYSWSTGESGPSEASVNIQHSGSYCVTLTSNYNCTYTQCVNVIEVESPMFNFEINSDYVIINVTEGNPPYEYSIDGMNWQDDNKLKYERGGLFTIFVREKTGVKCITSKTINIPFIPNVITPNNDGLNDFWDLTSLAYYNLPINVKIYNRQGKLIKNETNLDGKVNFEKVKTDNYWYIITIEGFVNFKGWLLIKNR
ncbi:T9SS type B sorting domain-containing protein [Epilithonimonas sp.]|uniref:T9SS type B sorting domain-containing protein n=1 Tax=Epilithonimonas sp. TaxID=2894511 RepID=UPI0028A1669C|nr:T9SS type B sorting domain-containing protein [Epilithonimonas sp.]